MQIAAQEERPVPRPLSVALIVLPGAGDARTFADRLRREVIEVQLTDETALLEAPDRRHAIAVIWVPAKSPAETYRRVVEWARQLERPLALIGCGVWGTSTDSEHALAAGFDDFVAGQCSEREVAARIRALHRRLFSPELRRRSRERFGRVLLDGRSHQMWVDGQAVPLTATELSVMRALVRARGHALSRGEILDSAWAGNLEVGERAVDNVILRLRRKLGSRKIIETIRGVGFRVTLS